MISSEDFIYSKNLEKIITENLITPVFQPIISLNNGDVFGFEALSRISEDGLFKNVEEMFQYAEMTGSVWKLEQVCRRAILQGIAKQKELFDSFNGKLFINVNPKILHDEKFQTGFTREYTKRYGIESEGIIIEITERQRIEDEDAFANAINHYKLQNYQIAVDDVGSAYSSLNRICKLSPGFIKLDIELVRDIHKNPIKLAMVKGLVEFATCSGTQLIAEGIESEKELELLIDLGVHYGQGYCLSRPNAVLQPCDELFRQKILKRNDHNKKQSHLGTNRYIIKNIITSALTVSPHVKAETLLNYIEKNEEVVGICVVDNEKAVGILTREKLLKQLSGRYGFSLHHNKSIIELADKNFLQVDAATSISSVSKIAMERDIEKLYDFIVINENEKYIGIVTVQDLLKRTMDIQVNLAKSSNPLTGLPGNLSIEQEIKQTVSSGEQYTIYYLDLDNFKAFNDVYGFEKGDEVIQILSDILKGKAKKDDFVGHIGGDDFVMICRRHYDYDFAEEIQKEFESKSHLLYSERDQKQNFICTYNRHGILEQFPLVSVTIVSVSNRHTSYDSYEEIVSILSHYKKEAKTKKKYVS